MCIIVFKCTHVYTGVFLCERRHQCPCEGQRTTSTSGDSHLPPCLKESISCRTALAFVDSPVSSSSFPVGCTGITVTYTTALAFMWNLGSEFNRSLDFAWQYPLSHLPSSELLLFMFSHQHDIVNHDGLGSNSISSIPYCGFGEDKEPLWAPLSHMKR